MKGPLFYILAPFALAFGLFVVYLLVGILMGDPARPFRMFAAGPLRDPVSEAERILDSIESGDIPEDERAELRSRLQEIIDSGGEGERWERIFARSRDHL
ncbi:MAG: hypothetical protein JSV26_02105 [bacterium]|nr:MAG: hypothetical protein JSV26_02105 [bacterium]